jgi:hypothetical protein
MNFDILFEGILKKYISENIGKKIVIFPGGFHPFHLGHKSVFDNIEKQFPDTDTYIAITDYTEERPFTADEKKLIIQSTGINGSKIKVVKSPFRSEEILKKYNPKKDIVIFAISEKERNDPKKAGLFTRIKKDGTPSYFQDYTTTGLQPFEKHGYIYVFPSIEFKINGKAYASASQLRNEYKKLNDKQKISFLKQLYKFNFDAIKKIFDAKLDSKSEEDESINATGTELDKQRLGDELKNSQSYINTPPYQVDGQLTVGRFKS